MPFVTWCHMQQGVYGLWIESMMLDQPEAALDIKITDVVCDTTSCLGICRACELARLENYQGTWYLWIGAQLIRGMRLCVTEMRRSRVCATEMIKDIDTRFHHVNDARHDMRLNVGRNQVSELCLSSWTWHDVKCDDELVVIFLTFELARYLGYTCQVVNSHMFWWESNVTSGC